MQESLVPTEEKFQFATDMKEEKVKDSKVKVIDEKKPYYIFKIFTEGEGILFSQYYSDKSMAVEMGDGETAKDCFLKICNLAVKECVNGAKKVEDLTYLKLFALGNAICNTNFITVNQEKK